MPLFNNQTSKFKQNKRKMLQLLVSLFIIIVCIVGEVYTVRLFVLSKHKAITYKHLFQKYI